MKICPGCGTRFESSEWDCPACHAVPPRLGGFPAFAPQLAQENQGFRPEYYAELAAVEERNFWFRSRNRLAVWALARHFPAARKFLEIGCGTGYVLSGITAAFPGLECHGSEIFSAGLPFAAGRTKGASLFQMDARSIPFEDEFDVIGAFDVLEHIEEDRLVLSQMFRAVSPGGGIILTVPQHRFLWSRQDDYACHVRRYEAHELKDKVEQAGFRIERVTSFVSLLLPLMLMSRLSRRKPVEHYDAMKELRIGGLANAVLEKILDLERALIRAGISLPMGGSLLLIARKP